MSAATMSAAPGARATAARNASATTVPMVTTTVVVKLGGRVLTDPRLPIALATRFASAHQRIVVVHGAADEVSALQRAFGVTPTFVAGLRVTSADDIDRIRMALSGLANKRLTAALITAGIPAVGVSGEDGPILIADPADDGVLGAVGTVAAVHTALLDLLLGGGYLPVVAPLARAARTAGGPPPATAALNINADDGAATIAAALGAHELLLVADVERIRTRNGGANVLDRTAAEAAIASGEIQDGMAVKVRAALAALRSGVPRVRIGGVAMITGESAGTSIVPDGAES
jgi:acetylglutamate kinase